MTFNGFSFDCSANPNLSKKIKEIGKSLLLPLSFPFIKDSNFSFAILKIFKTPFEVVVVEPWKQLLIILG